MRFDDQMVLLVQSREAQTFMVIGVYTHMVTLRFFSAGWRGIVHISIAQSMPEEANASFSLSSNGSV
jgi:hypothetical protein